MKSIIKFLKFSLASAVSTVLDLLIFTFISKIIFAQVSWYSIFIATSIARILATLFNYILSKYFVFENTAKIKSGLVKYYIVALSKMLVSWILVYVGYNLLSIDETIIKIPVDIMLFFVGYILQKCWVFRDELNTSI